MPALVVEGDEHRVVRGGGYRRCRPSFTVGWRPIPGRRFDDLFNLVHDPATLIVAWDRVATNRGAKTAGAWATVA